MSKPRLKIIEQPAEKSFRFRYESEGRSGGSLLGTKSTRDCISYPKVQVLNFSGPVVICVTCVTSVAVDQKYRQHPHKLSSSKNKTREGGHYEWEGTIPQTNTTSGPSDVIEFKDMGIIFVKRQNIVASLTERRAKQFDTTNGKNVFFVNFKSTYM